MTETFEVGSGPRMLIVGPPGAGKGTQAARLSALLDIPTISTGDIFRFNIRNETPLGAEVKAIVDAGDYVPDSLTNALVTDRLNEADARGGFLLDGYPRTADQVRYLDELLASHGHALNAVIRLKADKEEIVARLRKRAIDQGRVDDSEESIRHRQDVYLRETEPLITLFRDREILVEVNGLGAMDDVNSRIISALKDRGVISDEDSSAVVSA
ncbi:MAG: adenylate kinase [Terrimesophilobacter sp.]